MISGVFWKLAGKNWHWLRSLQRLDHCGKPITLTSRQEKQRKALIIFLLQLTKFPSTSHHHLIKIGSSVFLHNLTKKSQCICGKCVFCQISPGNMENLESQKKISKLKAISQFSRESMISQSTVFGSDKWLNEGNSIQTFGDEHDNPLFGTNPKKYWTFHPLGAAVTRMNRRGL